MDVISWWCDRCYYHSSVFNCALHLQFLHYLFLFFLVVLLFYVVLVIFHMSYFIFFLFCYCYYYYYLKKHLGVVGFHISFFPSFQVPIFPLTHLKTQHSVMVRGAPLMYSWCKINPQQRTWWIFHARLK